jgi:hypothetical protein
MLTQSQLKVPTLHAGRRPAGLLHAPAGALHVPTA